MSEHERPVLLVMRLADMHRRHPKQDNSHACSKCGEKVGVYPSGQDVLRHNPRVAIVCSACALVDIADSLQEAAESAAESAAAVSDHAAMARAALGARLIAEAAYRDARFPCRPCDRCGLPYRGPAVYCSFACALADA